MALYYEAAEFLDPSSSGALADQVYRKKPLKSKPGHIYALISQSHKWSHVLSDIIDHSDLLRIEKKVGADIFRHLNAFLNF